MKTFVLRDVDGRLFTEDGHGLTTYPNKYDGEQTALRLAAAEPNTKFRLATLSDKTYCLDPSTLWSTPDSPAAWKNQIWRQGWYELWKMKGEERHSMSSILLVMHVPELGPGMLKHTQFNLDGTPDCQTSTAYRPIRAFKVRKPNFSGDLG